MSGISGSRGRFGFFCGKKWGLAVGAIAPILRSTLFGRPVMFPMAVCMMFELAVLGFAAGLLYEKLPAKKSSVYLSLVVAIILGRVMFSLASFVFMGVEKGLWFYMAGAVTGGYPGLIIQLILIPILVLALKQYTVRA